MVIPLVSPGRAELVRRRLGSPCGRWYDVLDAVKDPEVPVVSIWELGVLQDVVEPEPGCVEVTITPTYSGCPAMEAIREDVVRTLKNAGAVRVSVRSQLSPAWTTDWMDPEARKRLRAFGIAPPDDLSCPQCGSGNVQTISEFGATACKALVRCEVCGEPFDYFKAF